MNNSLVNLDSEFIEKIHKIAYEGEVDEEL